MHYYFYAIDNIEFRLRISIALDKCPPGRTPGGSAGYSR